MKIISLSSCTAGPACAIACAIKQYFYNNNYQTNMFDYLEISLLAIIQVLLLNPPDIEYLSDNNEISLNIDDNNSVKFKNFDKIISHHDLKKDYNSIDYSNFIEKYKRRYHRLVNDIKNQNKIFFIRYGIEDETQLSILINTIIESNKNLELYFINIINHEYNFNYKYLKNTKNFIVINLYNNLNNDEDLFLKTLNSDWKPIYDFIISNLSEDEQKYISYNGK
jgi:hypothetical protein